MIEFYILTHNNLFCVEYQVKTIRQFCKDPFHIIIPSEEFLIALHPTTNNGRVYWFNCPLGHLNKETIKLCEWYRYTNCRVYFDSIDDLVLKIGELTPEVVDEKKKWCRIYASEIEKKNMQMWSDIFEPGGSPAI